MVSPLVGVVELLVGHVASALLLSAAAAAVTTSDRAEEDFSSPFPLHSFHLIETDKIPCQIFCNLHMGPRILAFQS